MMKSVKKEIEPIAEMPPVPPLPPGPWPASWPVRVGSGARSLPPSEYHGPRHQ